MMFSLRQLHSSRQEISPQTPRFPPHAAPVFSPPRRCQRRATWHAPGPPLAGRLRERP